MNRFSGGVQFVDALVVGSHLRWRGVWQRPNHILSRLTVHARVIVVEEPLAAEEDRDLALFVDGLTLVVPERRVVREMVDEETIDTVRKLAGDGRAAVWLYSPLMAPLLDAFPDAPLIYDKMDELAAFRGADARMKQRELEVLARADMVFAGGRSLWETVRDGARAGAAFPSGVDAAHFVKHLDRRSENRRPTFGYIGVLDERIDLALIADLASARPDATLEFVGPVAKIDAATLPVAPNIRYHGKIEYDAIPHMLARFDVALMPFARNPATRYISPTKTLEYLAAGLPVVSTDIPDVVSDFSDVVYIAAGKAAFIAAVAKAERPDGARRERGFARAARQSWDAIVSGMLEELRSANVSFALPAEPHAGLQRPLLRRSVAGGHVASLPAGTKGT